MKEAGFICRDILRLAMDCCVRAKRVPRGVAGEVAQDGPYDGSGSGDCSGGRDGEDNVIAWDFLGGETVGRRPSHI